MKKDYRIIVWEEGVEIIECPKCGEVIARKQGDASGNFQPKVWLRFRKEKENHHKVWDEADEIEKKVDAWVSVHTDIGKCFGCNLPVQIKRNLPPKDAQNQVSLTPLENVQKSDEGISQQAHRRWKEQGLILRCECGEQISSIEQADMETMKQRRFNKPEYKPVPRRRRGLRPRVSAHDSTLLKENLEHFYPPENRVLLDGLQEWLDKHNLDIHDVYDPFDWMELPYKTIAPELARYFLAIRLKFDSEFQNAVCRVSWSRNELTVVGKCFKCGVDHRFSPEYREDFLLRCVEVLEERRKRANRG